MENVFSLDPASVNLTGSGSLHASFHVNFPRAAFPDQQWTDFAIIAADWHWRLLEMQAKRSIQTKLLFMEGPYFLLARHVATNVVSLTAVTERKGKSVFGESLMAPAANLVAELRTICAEVLAVCEASKIYSRDVYGIRAAVAESESHRHTSSTGAEKLLSRRQYEIFELIARGLETRQIAEALKLSRASIGTHKARIREKLGLRSAEEMRNIAAKWMEK